MGDHRAQDGFGAGAERMRRIGDRDIAGFEQAVRIEGPA
jgi:adenylosuccinate synthase